MIFLEFRNEFQQSVKMYRVTVKFGTLLGNRTFKGPVCLLCRQIENELKSKTDRKRLNLGKLQNKKVSKSDFGTFVFCEFFEVSEVFEVFSRFSRPVEYMHILGEDKL